MELGFNAFTYYITQLSKIIEKIMNKKIKRKYPTFTCFNKYCYRSCFYCMTSILITLKRRNCIDVLKFTVGNKLLHNYIRKFYKSKLHNVK